MITWIFIAAIGAVLAVLALLALLRRYLRGELTGRYLAAIVVGLVSFASFALLGVLRPDLASGPAIIVLLPGFVAILVVIREHRRAKGSE